MCYRLLLIAWLLTGPLFTMPARSYVGPGVGITMLGSFWVIVSFVGMFLAGFLLMPLLLVLGLFLKIIVSIVLVIFAVWLLGKITLITIEHFKKRDHQKADGKEPGNNIPLLGTNTRRRNEEARSTVLHC